MKKTKTNRTLKLSTETVRQLSNTETGMGVVAGARVSNICTAGTCSVNDTCVCKCLGNTETM